MNPTPGPVPRIPKGVFFTVDGFLLLIAFLIAWVEDPAKPVIFTAIIGCVVLAALVALVPFLLDYAADTAEENRIEQARVSEQTARLAAAVEQLGRAAAQIKAAEEAVHKAARDAEALPYRMQEKLAEFNTALAEKEDDQRNALEQELSELRAAHSEQLKAAAAKIQQTVSELAAIEKNARAQVASTGDAADRLAASGAEAADRVQAALSGCLAQLDERIAALARAVTAADRPAPLPAAEPVSPPAESQAAPAEPAPTNSAEAAGEAPAAAADIPDAAVPAAGEPPKPRKSRAPRKTRPEDVLAAMSADSPSEPAADSQPAAPPGSADAAFDTAPSAESSSSSDGATRLLATAYIGIGNKLFIRGDAPGLSWDSGIPMQFVSIGKWGWFSHEASGPVHVMLYKNDETPALSGEIVLEPGKHTEVTALF